MDVLSWTQIWKTPLPHLSHSWGARFSIRVLLTLGKSRLIQVQGLENLTPNQDPFILTLNHNQRFEAIFLPALLALHRGGRMVHFLMDWLVLLYPLLGRITLYNEPIIVTRKSAKWRWLNRFKRKYAGLPPAFEQAEAFLRSGKPVGMFPEGTMNRNPERLLQGYSGAAHLSLTTQTKIVPVGISFPRHRGSGQIGDWEPFCIRIGAALPPPKVNPSSPLEVAEIRDWHRQIMQAISRLSGKQWTPGNQRTRYVA